MMAYNLPLLLDLPTPLQPMTKWAADWTDAPIWVKRDDLAHPHYGGNKWRKLYYNIAAAFAERKTALLTFGGAHSNHIAATAAAGKALDMPTIGIIRGSEPAQWSPTLLFAQAQGMHIEWAGYVPFDEDLYRVYQQKYPAAYLLPMGGANEAGVRGCEAIVHEVRGQLPANQPIVWCVAAGTGTTAAGIARHLATDDELWVVAALKGATWLAATIRAAAIYPLRGNLRVLTEYHGGGYARLPQRWWAFSEAIKAAEGLQLDYVYTAKLFYGVAQELQKGNLPAGKTIVMLHTGGVQGNAAMQTRLLQQQ